MIPGCGGESPSGRRCSAKGCSLGDTLPCECSLHWDLPWVRGFLSDTFSLVHPPHHTADRRMLHPLLLTHFQPLFLEWTPVPVNYLPLDSPCPICAYCEVPPFHWRLQMTGYMSLFHQLLGISTPVTTPLSKTIFFILVLTSPITDSLQIPVVSIRILWPSPSTPTCLLLCHSNQAFKLPWDPETPLIFCSFYSDYFTF